MNGLRNSLISAFLCAAAIGCADQSEPDASRVTVRDPVPQRAPETQSPNTEDTRPQDASEEPVVVYFGSFRDRLAAAKYMEHLHSMGLFRVHIRTAKTGGVEMLVTEPMERAAAQELAESLNGRVMSEDWLRRSTKYYDLLTE